MLLRDAEEKLKGRTQAEMIVDAKSGSGVSNVDDPLVQLRFYSLRQRSVIYTINWADSLLKYDMEANTMWVLRVQ